MNVENLNVTELTEEELVDINGGRDGRHLWHMTRLIDCVDAWIASLPEGPSGS